MRLSALALDYDGTIAVNGEFDPAVRLAIGDASRHGVSAILVTGRRLHDLRALVGDLACFDAIVAENGAVIDFPASRRHMVIGHPPPPSFFEELRRRGIPFEAGECVLEAEARWAGAILEVIRSSEQPLTVVFNRGRLMVLPQGIAKATGLRQALFALRISIHNTIGIGDAENDHDLLAACEVGVAVAWGSSALRAVADGVVEGLGPAAVADYIRRVVHQPNSSDGHMGRRRLMLGHERDGEEVDLALRGRPLFIAGEPGTGKSWLAGLACEQSILQGYCLCVIDPEGDYRTLEALPGGIVLGGGGPLPNTEVVTHALSHPDVSVVLDLSKGALSDKREYLRTLLPLLVALRRSTGLPHGILLDEAHYFLSGADAMQLIDPGLSGYIFVTYRISMLPAPVREAADAVVMVTRETDPDEINTLVGMCRPQPCAGVSPDVFRELSMTEAALLPGAEEAHGRVRRFQMAPRLTPHVRHRSKYLEVPVPDSEVFVFTHAGRPGARARTLKELTGLLAEPPAGRLVGHLRRHDFSKWIAGTFRDPVLASDVRAAEERIDTQDPREVTDAITRAIRARYDTARDGIPTG